MLKTKFRDLIYSILIMIHAILFSAVSLLSDAGAYPEEVTGERLWIDHAATLVERAATGRAEGKRFTNDVKAQRAVLRELMQRPGTDIPEARRQLHMSMVLLGVLLKTAFRMPDRGACGMSTRSVEPVGYRIGKTPILIWIHMRGSTWLLNHREQHSD